MERFIGLYYEISKQAANVRTVILAFLRKLPFLSGLPDRTLEWIFIGMVSVVIAIVIFPLIKWSVKVAMGAAVLAGALAICTSISFWELLPFTSLGVAIVLFSNRFRTE